MNMAEREFDTVVQIRRDYPPCGEPVTMTRVSFVIVTDQGQVDVDIDARCMRVHMPGIHELSTVVGLDRGVDIEQVIQEIRHSRQLMGG